MNEKKNYLENEEELKTKSQQLKDKLRDEVKALKEIVTAGK